MSRIRLCALVVGVVCLSAGSASANFLLHTQDFNSVGPSGTAPPGGWTIGHLNPVKNRDNTGGEGAAIVGESLLVDNGGGTGGSSGYSYNYGTTGANDRALGNIPRTGNGDHLIQVAITNSTPVDLTSIILDYWGEQWHLGESKAASKPEKLRVYYSATSSTSGFVRMTAFDFIVPQDLPGQPQAALDGNLPANRALVSGSYTPASPIARGATFYVRWYDYNDDATLDHGLAIDDVQVIGVPEPATIGLLALGGLALLWRRHTVGQRHTV